MDNNKKFWNRAAKHYARVMSGHKDIYGELNQIFADYLKESDNLLEIGCATGQLSYFLVEMVNRLTATDFSEEMIAICQANNTHNKITFKVEDASNLSFADNQFDAVVIANVLHIVPNIDQIIAELKRVVKPQGNIIAPIFVYSESRFNIMIWLLERFGFKAYNKFTTDDYINRLEANGLKIKYRKIIKAKPLSEFVVIATEQ